MRKNQELGMDIGMKSYGMAKPFLEFRPWEKIKFQ